MSEELYVRIKQALNWLKRNKGILQKDIAEKMGMAESSFTRALSRIKEKNDEDFVISFHSAVNEYISLNYLLSGEGDLLVTEEKVPRGNLPMSDTDKLIASLEEQIKDKERIIKLLEQKIEMLEAMEHIDSENSLRNYPFPVGVADNKGIQPNK